MKVFKEEEVYIVGIHRYSFRRGEPARIKGVYKITPTPNLEPRMCYKVEFNDGVQDWIPVSAILDGHYDMKVYDSAVN